MNPNSKERFVIASFAILSLLIVVAGLIASRCGRQPEPVPEQAVLFAADSVADEGEAHSTSGNESSQTQAGRRHMDQGSKLRRAGKDSVRHRKKNGQKTKKRNASRDRKYESPAYSPRDYLRDTIPS